MTNARVSTSRYNDKGLGGASNGYDPSIRLRSGKHFSAGDKQSAGAILNNGTVAITKKHTIKAIRAHKTMLTVHCEPLTTFWARVKMFWCSESERIREELEKQIKLACAGALKPVKDLQTATGVKDSYTPVHSGITRSGSADASDVKEEPVVLGQRQRKKIVARRYQGSIWEEHWPVFVKFSRLFLSKLA
ncbi:hypothetical protein B0H14DRAFT_3580491 [Mycena olivaceomarginata]|nr:hypothetical protein B0H14DRAFT_3580491 [Mycena olivaceomarginata]